MRLLDTILRTVLTIVRYAFENSGESCLSYCTQYYVLYAAVRYVRKHYGQVRIKLQIMKKRFFLFSARLLRNSKRRTMPDRPENDDDLRLRSRRRRKTRWRRGLLQVRDRGKDVGDTDDRGVFEVRNLTLFSLDTLRVRFPVTIGPFDQWWAGIFTFSWTVLGNVVPGTIFKVEEDFQYILGGQIGITTKAVYFCHIDIVNTKSKALKCIYE